MAVSVTVWMGRNNKPHLRTGSTPGRNRERKSWVSETTQVADIQTYCSINTHIHGSCILYYPCPFIRSLKIAPYTTQAEARMSVTLFSSDNKWRILIIASKPKAPVWVMSTHVSLLGGLRLQISALKQAILAGIFCFIYSVTPSPCCNFTSS